MSGRDPFPSPKFENCFTLSGFKPQQRKSYNNPTHIAQTEEPWSHLHDAATTSSSRHSAVHYEDQAPKDSLDFQLKSIYNHHKDFFWSKNQILYQKETASRDYGKEVNLEKEDMLKKEAEGGIRVWVDPQRRSIHRIK